MNLTAPFIAINVENVIYYTLYHKKIDIRLKIFENFRGKNCNEIGFPSHCYDADNYPHFTTEWCQWR